MRRALRPFFSLLLFGAFLPPAASAQCLLSPDGAGQNAQTRLQNFQALVDALYATDLHPTHRLLVQGKTLQVPPWYDSSTDCAAAHLKSGSGAISLAAPSAVNYLMVSDELSELAVVTALANSDSRMMEIHNTVTALESATYAGLPCWIAEVDGNSLTCRSQDTATDATARFGLAYYFAASNPAFLPASRAIYRAAGDALAARHLAVEYAQGTYTSPISGRALSSWVAGGGNSAAGAVGNSTMWIGYHQDVARFLLAAYVSTGQTVYLNRAEDVVDQWLAASTFDGTHLTFGRFNFSWDTSAQPLAPKPGDSYWWQSGRAWDDADAPRALWMGDVLRAYGLATAGAPLTPVYQRLSQWVQAVHASGSQAAPSSCIQYNQDGTWVAGNCGTDYYYNGLAMGLHTYLQTASLGAKLDTALAQFGWTGSHTWSSTACFGIYRGVRPLKALAAAIGLDSPAYGGTACGSAAGKTLSVSRTGAGTVTGSPAGIDCGSTCVATYGSGATVTLSASPAAGSVFSGWTGACSGTGSCAVTLSVDRAVGATFSAATLPTAPSWLRVTASSASQIHLQWDDNSANETGFQVERKYDCCGPWIVIATPPANSTQYDSTGLLSNASYAYRVRAVNGAGSSAYTNEARTSTLP